MYPTKNKHWEMLQSYMPTETSIEMKTTSVEVVLYTRKGSDRGNPQRTIMYH